VIWVGFIEGGRVTSCERCPGDTYESALAKSVEFRRNEPEDSGLVFCGDFDGCEFERFSVMGTDAGKVSSPTDIRRFCELVACSILFGTAFA